MGLYAGRAGRQWCLGIACLVGVLLSAAPAFAQFDRGQISGVIKDETGGVMPGVTVTATQVQTQTVRTVVTDASGFYTFASLPAGRYNIGAELQGFKKSVKEGVQLDATGALTIDFALSTGALTEQVTVTAEQTLLRRRDQMSLFAFRLEITLILQSGPLKKSGVGRILLGSEISTEILGLTSLQR